MTIADNRPNILQQLRGGRIKIRKLGMHIQLVIICYLLLTTYSVTQVLIEKLNKQWIKGYQYIRKIK